MTGDPQLDELAERVKKGDARGVARAMRLVDDRDPRFLPLLKQLYGSTGHAYVLGVTGTPGAGKSTLVDRLIRAYRADDRKVGVVAVDPTSPFSGGAILGDRIRMQQHFTDPKVFIRSLATRGHLGGLSRSAGDITRLLDAAGYDVIIVETVGVGQDELEVARLAHTTIVVMAPGLGDDVQASKAGILEVADVFAVNKSDREGADATVRDLEQMIALGGEMQRAAAASSGHGHAGAAAMAGKRAAHGVEGEGEWTPPVVKTIASRGDGLEALFEACAKHRHFLFETEAGQRVRARQLGEEMQDIFREALLGATQHRLRDEVAQAAERVARGETDPYTEAEKLVTRALSLES